MAASSPERLEKSDTHLSKAASVELAKLQIDENTPEKKSVSQKSPRKKKDTKTNRRAQRRSIDSAIFAKLEKSQNPQVKEDLMMTTKPSTKHEEDFSVQETPSGRRRRHTFTFARNKI